MLSPEQTKYHDYVIDRLFFYAFRFEISSGSPSLILDQLVPESNNIPSESQITSSWEGARSNSYLDGFSRWRFLPRSRDFFLLSDCVHPGEHGDVVIDHLTLWALRTPLEPYHVINDTLSIQPSPVRCSYKPTYPLAHAYSLFLSAASHGLTHYVKHKLPVFRDLMLDDSHSEPSLLHTITQNVQLWGLHSERNLCNMNLDQARSNHLDALVEHVLQQSPTIDPIPMDHTPLRSITKLFCWREGVREVGMYCKVVRRLLCAGADPNTNQCERLFPLSPQHVVKNRFSDHKH